MVSNVRACLRLALACVRRRLRTLSIGYNTLCAEGAELLSSALRDNATVQVLKVEKNFLGEDAAEDAVVDGVVELARSIRTMAELQTVTFSGDFIGSAAVTASVGMGALLLGGSLIGNAGVLLLAAFLPRCT